MCVDNAKLRALSIGSTIFSTMEPAKLKDSFQSNEAAYRIEAQLRGHSQQTDERGWILVQNQLKSPRTQIL